MRNPLMKRASLFCVLLLGLGLLSVTMTPSTADAEDYLPDTEGWFNHVEYYIGTANTRDQIRSRLISEINRARVRVDAAISELDDEEISEALIAAADRGVRVRLVADEHFEDSNGFRRLLDHDEIAITFGNGELAYLPDPTLSPLLTFCLMHSSGDHIQCTQARENTATWPANTDNVMARPSDFNVMSHTFFIIDETVVWNITAPLTEEQNLWLAFRVMSEEMTRSFEREFRQMHGGVFSTTLSVYNGPLKSITHTTRTRLTNEGQLRMRFNPQERLIKNIIDEVYRARASVFIMTENFQNRDLINAIRYKHENGFDVRVIYGQSQGATGLEALQEIEGLELVQASTAMGRLPTFIVLDSERDRFGGRQPTTVQILSHDLWRSEPFDVLTWGPDDRVRIFPSDTFADGVLWEIVENWGEQTPAAVEFANGWKSVWNQVR